MKKIICHKDFYKQRFPIIDTGPFYWQEACRHLLAMVLDIEYNTLWHLIMQSRTQLTIWQPTSKAKAMELSVPAHYTNIYIAFSSLCYFQMKSYATNLTINFGHLITDLLVLSASIWKTVLHYKHMYSCNMHELFSR